MLSFDHFVALKRNKECEFRVGILVDETVNNLDDFLEASMQLLILIILVWLGCFFLEKLVILSSPAFVSSQIAFSLVGSIVLR